MFLLKYIIFVPYSLLLIFSCATPYSSERVWSGIGPGLTGDISPDGKYLSDINWDTGDLKLINIRTNEMRDLTGEGYETGYAWMSEFSTNGKNIAYEWYHYQTGTHELRIYSFETSDFKTLIPANEEVLYLEPLDWSRNDDQILVAKQEEYKNWELGMVSTNNGLYKKIIELDWNAPGGLHPFAYPNANLSPDDKFIGFDYKTDVSLSYDLFTVCVKTGTMNILYKGEGNDRFLSWSEDGKEVLFYSDRSGLPSLWKLKVKDGKSIGEPKMIMENVQGLTPIGLSKKGFVYGVRSGDFNTYTTELNRNTWEIIRKPEPMDSACFCRNNVGDWSRDGDSLMFIRFYDLPSARESVVIKSLNNQQEREIFFPWDFHNKTGTVAWVANDTILIDGNSHGYSGIHTFNLKTGEIAIPSDFGSEGFFQRFKTNSDGSKLYVEMRFQNPRVVVFGTSSGASSTVFEGKIIPSSLAVSPKDDKLAYLKNDSLGKLKLEVFDLKTDKSEVVTMREEGELNLPLTWTSDGKTILVGVTLPNKEVGLWAIDLNQELTPSFINLPEALNTTLITSQNGRYLALQSGKAISDYYFLKGF